MTKKNNVTIKTDVRSAAAVRQALFEATKGYTYDPVCVPERVVDIRKVILDLDEAISAVVESKSE